MIKVISLLHRLPGVTPAEYVQYYERFHAPLGLEIVPQMCGYKRNHVEAVRIGPPPAFSTITEMAFPDKAAFESFDCLRADPDFRRCIREDEANFIDSARTVQFVVKECVSKWPNR
jgi:uncharacterized protein (TIGR02118 family)